MNVTFLKLAAALMAITIQTYAYAEVQEIHFKTQPTDIVNPILASFCCL